MFAPQTLPEHFGTKLITIPEGWDIVSTLVYFANHAGGYRCRLVVGAMGMTYEDTPKMNKIGHVAATCLAKVKVPVTIVKNPWRSADGDRCAAGRVMRVGRNGKPGLTIAVAVDGTIISQRAFDYAVELLRPHDRLLCLHVADVGNREFPPEQRDYYVGECAKLTELGLQASIVAEFAEIHHTESKSTAFVHSDIVNYCEKEELDLLVMGSVELSKVTKVHTLGSVCANVAKGLGCHFTVIKNTSLV